jgi:cob(I)alamin adenosyltransferase
MSASSLSKTSRTGLVTVFTGDGKGKTTAAIGTAVRAAGHGLKVCVVFFLKGKMFAQGEVKALSCLVGVETATFGTNGWVKKGEANPEAREQSKKALAFSRSALSGGNFDMVVLDEVNSALDFGLIGLDDLLGLIRERPGNVDLILTGRGAARARGLRLLI